MSGRHLPTPRRRSASTPRRRRSEPAGAELRVSDLDEFDLIARLARLLPKSTRRIPVPLGDDAALVPTAPNTLITTDALVDGVHFRRDWSRPDEVGRRALEVNLSDIAAMGGRPEWAVVSLLLPSELPLAALLEFYRGMAASARRASVAVVGGNVSRTDGPFSATVTLLGTPEARHAVTRGGGRSGDLLVVTGTPGLAAAGRMLLEASGRGEDLWGWGDAARSGRGGAGRAADTAGQQGTGARRTGARAGAGTPEFALADPAARAALRRFLAPEARLAAGARIAAVGATALIDLSDGLAADLAHLCAASRCGADIEAAALPRARGFDDLCAARRWAPLDLILNGGDDYELLAAVPEAAWRRLAGRAAGSTRVDSVPLTVIGRLTSKGRGLRLIEGSGAPGGTPGAAIATRRILPAGWRHFGE
jgi:thiamine-monophosphate kinase